MEHLPDISNSSRGRHRSPPGREHTSRSRLVSEMVCRFLVASFCSSSISSSSDKMSSSNKVSSSNLVSSSTDISSQSCRSNNSSGTGLANTIRASWAAPPTSLIFPSFVAFSRVPNARLHQHSRLFADIYRCAAAAGDAVAVALLSHAFLLFQFAYAAAAVVLAGAAASISAAKSTLLHAQVLVSVSRPPPSASSALRRCTAATTTAAVLPPTHTPPPRRVYFKGRAATQAFYFFRRSLPFFLLPVLVLPPPSPTPHSPLPCLHAPAFPPSVFPSPWSPPFYVPRPSFPLSSSFSSSFPSSFPFLAVAAATAAGTEQRVVSPVPPVAVAGRDKQTLPTFASLREAASTADFSTWLQQVRRELHSWPELMFEEHRTSALIQLVLQTLGIPFTKGWGSDTFELSAAAAEQQRAAKRGTGVVAHIGTGAEPCVVLRADMDALPIHEKTDVPFRSKRENMMHACGHDVHVTLLLGAAALLKAVEPQLKGTVRLIFQPAEEGGAGGWCMREEGVLRLYPPARLIFGHHVGPELPTGVLATRKGVFFAAVSTFTIEMEGKGGHAAVPRLAIDAGPAVAALLQAIYAIGSREVSIENEDAGLLTVTKVHGGTALNVIPPRYEIAGTIRALTSATQMRLEKRLQDAAEHTAAVFRCTCRVHINPRRYVPLVNDPQATDFYTQVMAQASASGKVEKAGRRFGGEDFAFYLQEVPGAFVFIGVGSGAEVPGQPRSDFSLHSDFFAVDERVLSHGAAVEAHIALQALQHLHEEDEAEAAEGDPEGQDEEEAAAATEEEDEAGERGRGGGADTGAQNTAATQRKRVSEDSSAAATKKAAAAAGGGGGGRKPGDRARSTAEAAGQAEKQQKSLGDEGGGKTKERKQKSAPQKDSFSNAEEL